MVIKLRTDLLLLSWNLFLECLIVSYRLKIACFHLIRSLITVLTKRHILSHPKYLDLQQHITTP